MSKLQDANEVQEDEDSSVELQTDVDKNWRMSTEARLAIARGEGYRDTGSQSITSDSTSGSKSDRTGVSDTGKVLTDDREPGVSVHLHRHEDGVTISVKDQNEGKLERYNFNTGEGYEKNVSDMSPKEAQRRMRSEHTEYNPNRDRDEIPGFRSSTWPDPSRVEDGSNDER